MKPENPIEEIWRIRDQLGAEENYEVGRLFDRLRREQQQYSDRLVQPPRRELTDVPAILREKASPYGSDNGAAD